MRSRARSASYGVGFDPDRLAYLPNVNVLPGYTPKRSGIPPGRACAGSDVSASTTATMATTRRTGLQLRRRGRRVLGRRFVGEHDLRAAQLLVDHLGRAEQGDRDERADH